MQPTEQEILEDLELSSYNVSMVVESVKIRNELDMHKFLSDLVDIIMDHPEIDNCGFKNLNVKLIRLGTFVSRGN